MLGFCFGQGSMFFVNTYLMFKGEVAFVGALAIALGGLSLCQWIADGGGTYILRYMVDNKWFNRNTLFKFFVVRVLSSLSIQLLFYMIVRRLDLTDFIWDVLSWGPLVAVIWAANVSGLVDHYDMNKYLGIIYGLPWLLASVCVSLFWQYEYLGFALGLSYLMGVLVIVILQFWFLKGLINYSKNGMSYFQLTKMIMGFNLAYVSAQSFGRIIPIMVSSIADMYWTGVYSYARNISNFASQAIQFTRRVEFSKFLKLSSEVEVTIISLFKAQKLSVFVVLLGVISTIFLQFFFSESIKDALVLSIAMLSALFFWVASSGYGQLALAKGNSTLYGWVVFSTVIFSLFVTYLLIGLYGIYGAILGEVLLFICQLLVYSIVLKNKR